ncbi:MAG: twin transmembrane helix small protein [Pseudomonadota bacterium]
MLNDPLFITAVVACGIVALILARGISSFGKEGLDNAKRSNKLMRWRLIAQAVAVGLILLFVYVRGETG